MLFMFIFSQMMLAELWAKQFIWEEMCGFTLRVRPKSILQEWAWKRCKHCGHLKTSWNCIDPKLGLFSVAEYCSVGWSTNTTLVLKLQTLSMKRFFNDPNLPASFPWAQEGSPSFTMGVFFFKPYANVLFTFFEKQRTWYTYWFLKG